MRPAAAMGLLALTLTVSACGKSQAPAAPESGSAATTASTTLILGTDVPEPPSDLNMKLGPNKVGDGFATFSAKPAFEEDGFTLFDHYTATMTEQGWTLEEDDPLMRDGDSGSQLWSKDGTYVKLSMGLFMEELGMQVWECPPLAQDKYCY